MSASGSKRGSPDMDSTDLLAGVQALDDLELAILLCLMSGNHGIIQTDAGGVAALERELLIAGRRSFGLATTSFRCTAATTLEEFTSHLLVEKSSLADSLDYAGNDGVCIPNMVVIRDLASAGQQIQIQALELARSKRIFTHTAVQSAPRHFLLLFISDVESEPLVKHLRDRVYLSHLHDSQDGFPHSEDAAVNDSWPLMTSNDIDLLSQAAAHVESTVEMTRYLQDIVVFLRMHRAIAAGTTPLATKYLATMTKSLAALHGLPFITPSLVGLATRKVFRHRLVMVDPAHERSLQYGSDLAAVTALLDGITAETVIEEVMDTVECPV